jgi:hypothetical protein
MTTQTEDLLTGREIEVLLATARESMTWLPGMSAEEWRRIKAEIVRKLERRLEGGL